MNETLRKQASILYCFHSEIHRQISFTEHLHYCNHIWTHLTTCHLKTSVVCSSSSDVSSCCWCCGLSLTFMGSGSYLNDWIPAFAELNCVVSIRERVPSGFSAGPGGPGSEKNSMLYIHIKLKKYERYSPLYDTEINLSLELDVNLRPALQNTVLTPFTLYFIFYWQ